MADRFAHEIAYRGKELTKALASKQIFVCGAGALGSNIVETLCRQGVQNIGVVDFDRVEDHNINTQVYGSGDVGAMKVNALKNRMFKDTGVELNVCDKKLEVSNMKKILTGHDLIIDTFDNNKSRQIVSDWTQANLTKGVRCLHAGMAGSYGEIVWDYIYTVPQDTAEGDVCNYPLARNLVTLVTTVAAEEIIDFCLSKKPRFMSWSITLKDLAIRSYR
jgi:molybdopterin/thiamine biosynthesis adenylyltransferase